MPKQTRVTLAAMFPEMPSARAYQAGSGVGTTAKAALSRAFADLMKKVKHKHIHEIKMHVTIVREDKENERRN